MLLHLLPWIVTVACSVNAGELTGLVDPFWGNGRTESPESIGWARGWNWLKAQMGNTIPGALTPFGWVSVCAYTGNYPCGYGLLKACCEGVPEYADKVMVADGFTHFHHNGTGFAGLFYNYFLFSPGAEGSDFSVFSRLEKETASPGYYSATLADRKCSFEIVARPAAACHRYRFPTGKGRIVIDVKHIGLQEKAFLLPENNCHDKKCEGYEIKEMSVGVWKGFARFHQLTIYFTIHAKADSLKSAVKDGVITIETVGENAETFIGFSLADVNTACKRADEAVRDGFANSRRMAEERWEKELSRIRVRFSDGNLRRLFYSTLYFSFVKPIDTEIGFLDYFTLWDVYRTELPMVMSLFPDMARRMMDDMMAVSEEYGFYPIKRYMTGHRLQKWRDNGQATALSVYLLSMSVGIDVWLSG